MNKFIQAMTTKDTLTENAMVTHSTSDNPCLDLFFRAGAMRKATEKDILGAFTYAYAIDPITALKILFWARDARGGAGERRFFRVVIKFLYDNDDKNIQKLLPLIPMYGRWDDMLVLLKADGRVRQAIDLIGLALKAGDGLCAKWMPRKGEIASYLWKALGFESPKAYRKELVRLTNVVETAMCSGNWDSIKPEHVPSVAMSRYMKAFFKHTPEKMTQYLEAVKKGEKKINTSVVYPYDIIRTLREGDANGAQVMWDNLPEYFDDSDVRMIPVVDTSGSMCSVVSGNIQCLDVAVSLGLYLSERSKGPYKDCFITFSGKPQLQMVSGTLNMKYAQMKDADWGYNTDLEAVFKLILHQAVQGQVPVDEMPTHILILSDMEFDSCVRRTAMEMIKHNYDRYNYPVPQVVFWNIQSRHSNIPVKKNEQGVALVSGFSPSIAKNIMAAKLTPEQVMFDTINAERYIPIEECLKGGM